MVLQLKENINNTLNQREVLEESAKVVIVNLKGRYGVTNVN